MWLYLFLAAVVAAGFAVVWGWEHAPGLVILAAIAALVPLILSIARFVSSQGEERGRRRVAMRSAITRYITLSIVLGVGVFIAQANLDSQRARDERRQELREQGYVPTGREVTASECQAQGGHVEGEFCLRP
jgi:hypothetical protein